MVAGDRKVPGLGDRVNDSAEIGWLGRQWLVKSTSSIHKDPSASHGRGPVTKSVAPCPASGQASLWWCLCQHLGERHLPSLYLSAAQICPGR